jgi:hypothetical protein
VCLYISAFCADSICFFAAASVALPSLLFEEFCEQPARAAETKIANESPQQRRRENKQVASKLYAGIMSSTAVVAWRDVESL